MGDTKSRTNPRDSTGDCDNTVQQRRLHSLRNLWRATSRFHLKSTFLATTFHRFLLCQVSSLSELWHGEGTSGPHW